MFKREALSSLEFDLKKCNQEIEKHTGILDRLTRQKSDLEQKIQKAKIFESKRDLRKCGKTLYIDEYEALKHMKEINALLIDKNKLIKRAYFCTKCEAWHLTGRSFKQFETNERK